MRPKEALLRCLPILLLLALPSYLGAQEERPVDIEIIGHSWKLEEEWPKIGKTKYSWRATVRNTTDDARKVSVYYHLVDESEFPLARNTASRMVPPHQTVEIISDSYVENGIIERITKGVATVKSRPPSRSIRPPRN
jgi:hypothetical protein